MEGTMPWNGQADVISSDESSSSDPDVEINCGFRGQSASDMTSDEASKATSNEASLIKRAKMYQEYMKQLPIPMQRGSVIPFSSWVGLGKSIKQLYGQPLHYLTNILLKQWDQLRIGAEDEHKCLDIVIHPCKAEATIWLVEEIHRQTSSHDHIAKLWLSDPPPCFYRFHFPGIMKLILVEGALRLCPVCRSAASCVSRCVSWEAKFAYLLSIIG